MAVKRYPFFPVKEKEPKQKRKRRFNGLCIQVSIQLLVLIKRGRAKGVSGGTKKSRRRLILKTSIFFAGLPEPQKSWKKSERAIGSKKGEEWGESCGCSH